MTPPPPPRIRSALFVPASNERFLAGMDRHGADAVILDLEDSITEGSVDTARANVAATLRDRHRDARPAMLIRVRGVDADTLHDDLDAAVHPATQAVLLPKVRTADEVRAAAEAIAWHEGRRAVPAGSVRIWPLLESAAALDAAREIATASSRVAYLGGAVAEGGDLARDLGMKTTFGALESLYLRSRVLIVARAEGVPNPMTGMFTAIDDLDQLEQFARHCRSLGYDGMTVIHPSHVDVVNRVFGPDAETIQHSRAVIEALARAGTDGFGAVRLGDRMIDVAMAETARRVLAEWAPDDPDGMVEVQDDEGGRR